ncbi:uncharacterized protein LOC125501506 [Athalia rosae]|uniref:uncharacterized protein LOC125501506 n=1 Tax=Athalia rosae TaxID=37344 RepID=UPI00203326C7|nr:uncharacterized protein LOC125501506 [Athalia rosae]
MARRLSALLIVLSWMKLSRGALVLPRPPSSPNAIPHQYLTGGVSKVFDGKLYNDKPSSVYRMTQNNIMSTTNVEKPNTDDYKFLEIELRGGATGEGKKVGDEEEERKEEREEAAALNFGEILRQVFHSNDLSSRIKNAAGSFGLKRKSGEKSPVQPETEFSDGEEYHSTKLLQSLNDKLYYLKKNRSRPDTGNERRTSWEPRSYLKSMQVTNGPIVDKNLYATKSLHYNRPKKYIGKIEMVTDTNPDNRMTFTGEENSRYTDEVSYESAANFYTTENSLPTSSELPKQIPPPPSRGPSQTNFAHTTPVLKYISRRTDILPG